jgi:uncharacterized protein (TIGR00369 family)
MTDEAIGAPAARLDPEASDAETLDYIRRTAVSPAMTLLGCMPLATEAATKSCRVRFEVGKALCNAAGSVQGGQLCAMLDLVTSLAIAAASRFTLRVSTLELKTSFLRPAPPGIVFGDARVRHQGSLIVFLEGELHDGAGVLFAIGTATARVTPISPQGESIS